ncbi:MAG: arsenate reductase (azurin) small subunit [Nitrososphaerota archaeon]|nr:arsenate reductase (azurin) small subunit [Nitrososphaerota archaeon]
MEEQKKDDKDENPRRKFIKVMFAAGSIATIGGLGGVGKYLTPPIKFASQWPQIRIANVSQLQVMKPVVFLYPDTDTPNWLLKLGVKAEGGLGPDGDIVAFSSICQHLGCTPGLLSPGDSPPCNSSYKAQFPMAYCCCHGSQYDLVQGAKVIGGPAPYNLPPVKLQIDSNNDIWAVAMGPPNIYGMGPGRTDDPSQVLEYDTFNANIITQGTAIPSSG